MHALCLADPVPLTVIMRILPMRKFRRPVGKDVGETQIVRKGEIVAVLIQAPSKHWHIDRQKQGFESSSCRFQWLVYSPDLYARAGLQTGGSVKELLRQTPILDDTHLHHVGVALALGRHFFQGSGRVR